MVTFFAGLPGSGLEPFGKFRAALATRLGRPKVHAIVVLMLVKTLVDVVTTGRALRAG